MVSIPRGVVQISITIVLIGIYFITNGWIFLVLALLVLIFSLITNLREQQIRIREIESWNVKKPIQSTRKYENRKFDYNYSINQPTSSFHELSFPNSGLTEIGKKNHILDQLYFHFPHDRRIRMTSHRIKPESYLGNVPRVVFKVPVAKSSKPTTVKIKSNVDFKTHLKLEKAENREKSSLLTQVSDRSQNNLKENLKWTEDGRRKEIIKALKEGKRSYADDLHTGSIKKKRKNDSFDKVEPMEDEDVDDDEDENVEDEDENVEDEDEEDDNFLNEDECSELQNDTKNGSSIFKLRNEKEESKNNCLISGKYSKKNGFSLQNTKSSPNNEILSSYSSIRETIRSNPIKRKKSLNQSDLAPKICKTTIVTEVKDTQKDNLLFSSEAETHEQEASSQQNLAKQQQETKAFNDENANIFKSPYLHTIEEHERDMKKTQQRLGHFLKALSSIDEGEISKTKEKK